MNRRGFMQSILAASVAPWICTTSGILMPVRKVIAAPQQLLFPYGVAGDTISIVQYGENRILWSGSNHSIPAGNVFSGETGLFICTGNQWVRVGDS